MKPKKKKFDIKAFFVNHVEKVVLALVIPLAFLIAMQGTKFPRLSWEPEDLNKVAKAADENVKASKRGAADEGVVVTQYDVKAEWIKAKIHLDLYRTNVKWMPSLFPEKIKRTAVEVFTVEDLKAGSGLGAVAVRSGTPQANALNIPMGATHVGRRWAVITGLIPNKKQSDLFITTYSSSVLTDAFRDTPLYWTYDIERAEIKPDSNPNNLDWQKLSILKASTENYTIWAGFSADPVDPTYLAPRPPGQVIPMASLLPPVGKPFGEEVAHPPAIPMSTDTRMRAIEFMENLQEERLKEFLNIDEDEIFKNSPFDRTSVAGGGATALQNVPDMPARPEPNFLFRFFDFSVEIGKTYRYRVRLHLANPNYLLAPHLLEDPELSKEPFLPTAYSVPSNQVTIPLSARVLVNSTIAPSVRTPWAEPSASLYVIHFDMEDGSEWYNERAAVFRGQTANYKADGIGPPARTAMGGMGAGLPPAGIGGSDSRTPQPPPRAGAANPPRNPGGAPAPAASENKKSGIEYVSEVCVLDILGGTILQRTSGPELRAPGRVVVLEPSGAMRLRKVTADSLEIEHLKNPDAANRVGGAGGGFPGMGGPGMGGPDMGGPGMGGPGMGGPGMGSR